MDGLKNFRIKGNNKEVRRHLKDLCEQIVRAVQPQKIILFGSYAYGTPHEDSDIDLLVIMPFDVSPHQQAFKIRLAIDPPMPLDLLVRTPEWVAERIAMEDFFIQDIVEQGKVLYEADHTGMDQES